MNRLSEVLLFCVLYLQVTLLSAANAEIYKWIDEYGNAHYSNTPSEKGEQVNINQESNSSGFENIKQDTPIYYQGKTKARSVVIAAPEYNMDGKDNKNKLIGKLFFGKNCVAPRNVKFDDLNRWIRSVFAPSMQQAGYIKTPFARFNYSPIVSEAKWSENAARKYNALLLLPVVTDINIAACAQTANVMYLSSQTNYGSYTYQKAKIYLRVNWKLIDNEANPPYEAVTESYVSNWDGEDGFYSLREGVRIALEVATKNLLARQDFVDHFQARPDEIERQNVKPSVSVDEDTWSFRGMLNTLSGGYLQASKLSKALMLMTNIKVAVGDYFVTNGDMPAMLEDLGIHIPSSILQENYIGRLYLSGGGTINADLTDDFGKGAMLSLQPEFVESISTLHWSCYSNLEQNVLEKMNCKAM